MKKVALTTVILSNVVELIYTNVSEIFHELIFTNSEPEFRIGTALSDYTCTIYSVGEGLTETITLTHNQAPVVGIRFSPASRNILYTATSNGQITACDLRARGKVVAEFKGTWSYCIYHESTRNTRVLNAPYVFGLR